MYFCNGKAEFYSTLHDSGFNKQHSLLFLHESSKKIIKNMDEIAFRKNTLWFWFSSLLPLTSSSSFTLSSRIFIICFIVAHQFIWGAHLKAGQWDFKHIKLAENWGFVSRMQFLSLTHKHEITMSQIKFICIAQYIVLQSSFTENHSLLPALRKPKEIVERNKHLRNSPSSSGKVYSIFYYKCTYDKHLSNCIVCITRWWINYCIC